MQRPVQAQPPGDGPETAEIETPTLNAVPPGPGVGAMLAGNLARSTVSGSGGLARTPELSPRGNLHGRFREAGFTPLAMTHAGNNGGPWEAWDHPQRRYGAKLWSAM